MQRNPERILLADRLRALFFFVLSQRKYFSRKRKIFRFRRVFAKEEKFATELTEDENCCNF